MSDFSTFFKHATGIQQGPYPYQDRLANSDAFPEVLNVPTGLGKTAAVVLAWLYRRREHPNDDVRKGTPRRLIYCLPMRTLVEQTNRAVREWLGNLGCAPTDSNGVDVQMLMGGEDGGDWDQHPEREGILIGTQDMLLSRALNRGYGMSRYAWPVHYALLNNDCQWVLDETQLMGVGVTTSAQLAGLREKLETYGSCRTLWMSATLDADVLRTVDHPRPESGWLSECLKEDDKAQESVKRLIKAEKPCERARTELTIESSKKGYDASLAEEVLQTHRPGTLSLVVVNRVVRAQDIFSAIQKGLKGNQDPPEVCLIHSRFRPADREKAQGQALDETTIPPDGPGRIIVATQAIEAGVDVSATTLFTELAPWSSLVQRFGRCNRRGICGTEGRPAAQVCWIDIDTSDAKKAKSLTLPYEPADLNLAREQLAKLDDVGPQTLAGVEVEQRPEIVHVIRRKDVIELFDTTADLSGNDLDVSRYIRDSDDTDVQVYWRDWDLKAEDSKGKPPLSKGPDGTVQFPAPERGELCSVSIAAARDFAKKAKRLAWRWDPLDRVWRECGQAEIRPGLTILLHASAGGYDGDLGWTGNAKDAPVSDLRPEAGTANAAMDDDDTGSAPVVLTQHLHDVGEEATLLQSALTVDEQIPWDHVVRAAWWHDVGKSHEAFQGALRRAAEELAPEETWAKSGKKGRLIYAMEDGTERRGFRHELASALAWLNQHGDQADADLTAYLIAAHHGKVRMSIRSMPNENRPTDVTKRFARGIWDGDKLPRVEIGNGDVSEAFDVSLKIMELGDNDGRRSWLTRSLAVRDQFGPFRLAYLEALVRVADWRRS